MAVKIGSARSDEKGNITGGSSGDQTGNEVSTQSWYKHSKGWRVLRPNDPNQAEKIAVAMQAACNNSKIGYDQNQRSSLYTVAKKVGFDLSKVTTKCETDCSALVRVCCHYAGITVGDFNTSSLAGKLLGTKKFTELTGSKYTGSSNYLCRGDVLVTKTKGHAVVVLSNGSKAAARTTTTASTSGENAVNLNVTYTFGSRTMSSGMSGEDVRELQTKLTSLGYDCGVSTGIFDTTTLASVKSFQQDNNLAVNGNVTKAICTLIDKLIAAGSGKAGTSNTVTILSGDNVDFDNDELVIAIQLRQKTVKTDRTINGNQITDTTTTTQKVYYPPIEGDVTWDTERSGSPGKVTFTVRGEIPFAEGDVVSLTYGGNKVFLGYIFDVKSDKSGATSIIAYDQLRYFKNQDTYVFSNKTASEMLRQIANDYQMPVGTIENTSIAIKSFVADDKSLFDIIGDALDATISQTNSLFILYDDYGKITLKSANSMLTNLLLCEDTVVDYSYSSSIDEETYNQVILYYDNKKTNKREYFSATSSTSVAQWGLLRKTQSVDTSNGAQSLADAYLKTYNKKVRKLSVSDAFGRCDIRAGTILSVMMKVGDVNIKNFMMVEKASHKWSNGKYIMNLDLSGAGEFSV